MMNNLISVTSTDDILPAYRQTPSGLFLEYHNLNRPLETFEKAQLLVGMCMDNRKHAIAVGQVSYIAQLYFIEEKVL